MFTLEPWENLPPSLRSKEVKPYYDYLNNHKTSIFFKRLFDLIISLILTLILIPIMMILSLLIKLDSKGPILYKQDRITYNQKTFSIYMFRTMVVNADKFGPSITEHGVQRITKIGHFLRKYRLDEIPQVINILLGDMSFVGTRPEVLYYVQNYSPEMHATLLMPAGVTSLASIKFRDEQSLLKGTNDVNKTYIEKILSQKMKYNLDYLKEFSLANDLKIMLCTLKALISD